MDREVGLPAKQIMPLEEAQKKRNALLAQKVIRGLESRNMHAYYAETVADGVKQALALISESSVVTMGGSTSVRQSGLVEKLKQGNYTFIDRDEYEDREEAHHLAYTADWYLTSCNAVTDDGVMVNIDGNGNRVSAMAYGPEHVLYLVSLDKVCKGLEAAVDRAENRVAPVVAGEYGVKTPCTATGLCSHCKSLETRCCQILITRFSRYPDRAHVILVNESLGL